MIENMLGQKLQGGSGIYFGIYSGPPCSISCCAQNTAVDDSASTQLYTYSKSFRDTRRSTCAAGHETKEGSFRLRYGKLPQPTEQTLL